MARMLDVRNYIEPFYQYIDRMVEVKKEHVHQVIPFLDIKLFEKKAIILQQGEIDNYLNLVMKGMVRKYIPLKNNRQVTLQLATEGHFIQSDISFNVRSPSEVVMEAVESSIVIRMHYNKMNELFQKYPWSEEMARMLATQMAIKKDHRHYNLLKKAPRDRFLDYLAKNPHMLQRTPQKILASYLNIKPETFSRLKHLIRDNAKSS